MEKTDPILTKFNIQNTLRKELIPNTEVLLYHNVSRKNISIATSIYKISTVQANSI